MNFEQYVINHLHESKKSQKTNEGSSYWSARKKKLDYAEPTGDFKYKVGDISIGPGYVASLLNDWRIYIREANLLGKVAVKILNGFITLVGPEEDVMRLVNEHPNEVRMTEAAPAAQKSAASKLGVDFKPMVQDDDGVWATEGGTTYDDEESDVWSIAEFSNGAAPVYAESSFNAKTSAGETKQIGYTFVYGYDAMFEREKLSIVFVNETDNEAIFEACAWGNAAKAKRIYNRIMSFYKNGDITGMMEFLLKDKSIDIREPADEQFMLSITAAN